MNTGIVEVIQTEEVTVPAEHGEVTTLRTLMRLKPGVKEKDWVFKLVRPIREISWRYPGKWSVRTAKEYVDKEVGNARSIAYTFVIEVSTVDPVETNQVISQMLSTGMAPVPPEATNGSPILTLAEMPDEIIERPLVGAGADRNSSRLVPSAYGHITGQSFKPGAGARSVLNKK